MVIFFKLKIKKLLHVHVWENSEENSWRISTLRLEIVAENLTYLKQHMDFKHRLAGAWESTRAETIAKWTFMEIPLWPWARVCKSG